MHTDYKITKNAAYVIVENGENRQQKSYWIMQCCSQGFSTGTDQFHLTRHGSGSSQQCKLFSIIWEENKTPTNVYESVISGIIQQISLYSINACPYFNKANLDFPPHNKT